MAELKLGETEAQAIEVGDDLGLAQRRRLERLDLLLVWDASFGRKDLTDFFEISDQQASADIAKYREIAPHNSIYDTKLRMHVATEEFEPALVKPSADRYLDQLQGLLEENLEPGRIWFREVPRSDTVPRFHPDVKNHILRALLRAIRESSAVKIRYQPLNRSESNTRWIAPHALAFSGRRWHVRAFCFESEDFRDFVLTRILESSEFRSVTFETPEGDISTLDSKWQNRLSVKLVPCRDLPDDQQRVIAKDFGMDVRGRTVEVREAWLLYFVDWYRLDPTRFGQIPENERMIEAENWEEVSVYMPRKPLPRTRSARKQ